MNEGLKLFTRTTITCFKDKEHRDKNIPYAVKTFDWNRVTDMGCDVLWSALINSMTDNDGNPCNYSEKFKVPYLFVGNGKDTHNISAVLEDAGYYRDNMYSVLNLMRLGRVVIGSDENDGFPVQDETNDEGQPGIPSIVAKEEMEKYADLMDTETPQFLTKGMMKDVQEVLDTGETQEITYPRVQGRSIYFKSEFGQNEAAFTWNEWGVINRELTMEEVLSWGNNPEVNAYEHIAPTRNSRDLIFFNRKEDVGTEKPADAIWQLSVEITIL